MGPDPKYRPLERFWPYADLPEQPSDEELAALDPDLYEALFGARPRPFSITLVFPPLDVPEFDRLEIQHFFAVYKELEPGQSVEGAEWVGRAEAEGEIEDARRRLADSHQ